MALVLKTDKHMACLCTVFLESLKFLVYAKQIKWVLPNQSFYEIPYWKFLILNPVWGGYKGLGRINVSFICFVLQGFDVHGKPLLTLYFRVQFYVDQVVLLRWEIYDFIEIKVYSGSVELGTS